MIYDGMEYMKLWAGCEPEHMGCLKSVGGKELLAKVRIKDDTKKKLIIDASQR